MGLVTVESTRISIHLALAVLYLWHRFLALCCPTL